MARVGGENARGKASRPRYIAARRALTVLDTGKAAAKMNKEPLEFDTDPRHQTVSAIRFLVIDVVPLYTECRPAGPPCFGE